MSLRLTLLILVLCGACQSGKIPCPKIKTVKAKKTIIHKNFRQSETSLSAKANETPPPGNNKASSKTTKGTDTKVIRNVSVEEWDCPKPGTRKYMPKTVKENIKRNLKKIKSDRKEQNAADSLHLNQ